MKKLYWLLIFSLLSNILNAQHHEHQAANNVSTTNVEAQPLLAQASRLQEALSFSGSKFSSEDIQKLKDLTAKPHKQETVRQLQEILDPYCINIININPESRVKVERGMAPAKLVQGGWTSFLVKVNNEAGVTAKLEVESPNAAKPVHSWTFDPRVKTENIITPGEVANRFLEIQMYISKPLQPNLSGLKLEYAVV